MYTFSSFAGDYLFSMDPIFDMKKKNVSLTVIFINIYSLCYKSSLYTEKLFLPQIKYLLFKISTFLFQFVIIYTIY